MAIMLYRKGISTVVRGVECDSIRIDIKQMKSHLEHGWSSSLDELSPQEEKPVLEAKEVRALAEKLGIDDFAKKRIQTLKSEIDALNE